jgi:hypothetical protein
MRVHEKVPRSWQINTGGGCCFHFPFSDSRLREACEKRPIFYFFGSSRGEKSQEHPQFCTCVPSSSFNRGGQCLRLRSCANSSFRREGVPAAYPSRQSMSILRETGQADSITYAVGSFCFLFQIRDSFPFERWPAFPGPDPSGKRGFVSCPATSHGATSPEHPISPILAWRKDYMFSLRLPMCFRTLSVLFEPSVCWRNEAFMGYMGYMGYMDL